jgi:deoxyuridine 5'-triphosphate nucleotidohydrolase
MSKVYLVIGECGEWEEYNSWVESVHTNREDAERHAQVLRDSLICPINEEVYEQLETYIQETEDTLGDTLTNEQEKSYTIDYLRHNGYPDFDAADYDRLRWWEHTRYYNNHYEVTEEELINNMEIKIKKLTAEAIIPRKAHDTDAAFDLYVPKDTTVLTGREVVPLDIAIELPDGYCAEIQPRSGYASKGIEGNVRRMNADVLYGLIDSGYRGNVGVIINNHDFPFVLVKGLRIAQMIIRKVEDATFKETTELSDSDRADGGFGSTNK